jgi:hypothetical protein
MFLSPLSREGGCPKSSSSNGPSWCPGSWVPGCGAGAVIHASIFWATGPVVKGELRETGGRAASPWGVIASDGDLFGAVGRKFESVEGALGDGEAFVVLGAAAVLCGSPLPRVVRGAWAVVDPASPASASPSVASTARGITSGTATSSSGEAPVNVPAAGFNDSGLLTTLGSSLISQPE